MNTSPLLKGSLFGLCTATIWAGWILLTSIGVKSSLKVYDIAALRFLPPSLILLLVLLKRGFNVGKHS